ncbi:MAG: thioredoxin family protein, partial [Kiritimatiellae bacterium]|nr:thioredoxin family protein [Kiritimatiellia bacterium]
FGAGSAIAFGTLGLVAAQGGRAFGSLQGSRAFHFALAAVFAALALAALEVFRIDFSRFRSGFRTPKPGKATLPAAFAMGAVSALLSGACVAPVLASAIVLAADLVSRGHPAGALVPFVLGAGMGAPWPLLGAGLAALPKPGSWMRFVKPVYAAVFVALAAWQIAEGAKLARAGAAADAREVTESGSEAESEAAGQAVDWMYDPEVAVAVARVTKAPVLLELSADWCRECSRMDRTTFADPAVADAVADGMFAPLRVDCTDTSAPVVKRIFSALRVPGLPFSAVLRPGAAE